MYQKTCFEDFLQIGEKQKKYYILIKYFNTFTYDYTLNLGKKYFCRYCLQPFRTAEKLKCCIKCALKLMVNRLLRCRRRVNLLNSKTGRRMKSPCMIYADFESILVPEDNGQ